MSNSLTKAGAVPTTHIRRVTVDNGIDVFYREAGEQNASINVLLLHGFPASSFQYRNLITTLAATGRYRVIAPDLPGFGFTVVPPERDYKYTFENIAKTIEAFVDALNLTSFAVYIFDYGAPTGLRLALSRPKSILAIISQNGNAFEAGLGSFWDNIRPYWAEPTSENREKIRWLVGFDATKFQYTEGEAHPETIPPEAYHLDQALLDRPGNADIQLDLFLDYQNNVKLYPSFHNYFRTHQPPLLAIWGKNDPIFIPPGAEAFKEVLPKAIVKFVDGGHFALENHGEEIGREIIEFLGSEIGSGVKA
ncbi:alpha/beta hydrolase fold protein [Dendrothele bispora CBS 962.96]|uniref:Alpha/beta hydrolase fold protein n=1 Tax=Dendrothele bispora (strain CBS 962.96) TaxID=1314807 RepID=A0A4S8MH89_DENBC|nr:alpha/beta hydrolase fold protein [Dendrothele bispora CBS 962.96]